MPVTVFCPLMNLEIMTFATENRSEFLSLPLYLKRRSQSTLALVKGRAIRFWVRCSYRICTCSYFYGWKKKAWQFNKVLMLPLLMLLWHEMGGKKKRKQQVQVPIQFYWWYFRKRKAKEFDKRRRTVETEEKLRIYPCPFSHQTVMYYSICTYLTTTYTSIGIHRQNNT